jgi:hypothetical protein
VTCHKKSTEEAIQSLQIFAQINCHRVELQGHLFKCTECGNTLFTRFDDSVYIHSRFHSECGRKPESEGPAFVDSLVKSLNDNYEGNFCG